MKLIQFDANYNFQNRFFLVMHRSRLFEIIPLDRILLLIESHFIEFRSIEFEIIERKTCERLYGKIDLIESALGSYGLLGLGAQVV